MSEGSVPEFLYPIDKVGAMIARHQILVFFQGAIPVLLIEPTAVIFQAGVRIPGHPSSGSTHVLLLHFSIN